MGLESRPVKPVVPSQVAATKDFSRWLLDARRDYISDAEGQKWKVCFEFIFDDVTMWQVKLWLELGTTMQDLIHHQVLDASEDKRMIELLSSWVPPMKLKPRTLKGKTQEDCLMAIKSEVTAISEALVDMDLRSIKRKIIFQYLDQSLKFGFAE